MTKRTRRQLRRCVGPVALTLALALAACNHENNNATATIHIKKRAAARPNTGPSVEEQTKNMAMAASPGKGTAAIDIKFDIARIPAAGVALDIPLAFIPTAGADSLSVDLVPSDGLTLQSHDNPLQVVGLDAGKVYRRTVTVLATSDGMYYLGVVATLKLGEQQQARNFSIPLIVGNPVATVKAALRKD